MTSVHPTLPAQTLVPGLVDPTKTYGGTILRRSGPVIRQQTHENYSAPQQTMNLGDSRHKELLEGLKHIAQSVDQKIQKKTVEALQETREWRK